MQQAGQRHDRVGVAPTALVYLPSHLRMTGSHPDAPAAKPHAVD
jgi:hypothetical protein